MNEQHIARLEAQLERLVESTFASLFGKRVHAQDIALQLARAMEDAAINDPRHEVRPVAPDHYIIMMASAMRRDLLQSQPSLAQLLSEHLVELAMNAGYRLNMRPEVEIVANDEIKMGAVTVIANHGKKKSSTTAIMKRVDIENSLESPRNPQLLIQNRPAIQLTSDVINIGRSRDNQIVVDDRSVSRYHLQLRLRFGRYTLFDTQSQGGTLVNNVPVKEHVLQTGDVIQIGSTLLVYMEDHPTSDGQTQTNDPVLADD